MGSILDYCRINFNNQNAPDNTDDFGGYDLTITPTYTNIGRLQKSCDIILSIEVFTHFPIASNQIQVEVSESTPGLNRSLRTEPSQQS